MKKYSQADELLLSKAKNAMKFSYSPASGFKVGVALLSEDGKIFTGTNIEFDAYSLTICAERVALFKAISEGSRKFTKIAIAVSSKGIKYPCGSCRQALAEISPDIEVILSSATKCEKVKLEKLIPRLFKL